MLYARRQGLSLNAVVTGALRRMLEADERVEEFQRFCDRVSASVKAYGMTEEKLDETLND